MIYLSNNDLTRFVNTFLPGMRFQKVQALKGPSEGFVLKFESHPSPGKFLLAASPNSKESILLLENEDGAIPKLPGWAGQQVPPPILFLRAHFVGHKLLSVERVEVNSVKMQFEDGRSFILSFEAPQLSFEFSTPEKRSFGGRLRLAALPSLTPSDAAESPIEDKLLSSKRTRLLANIEADIEQARIFLASFEGVLRKLQEDPKHWDRRDAWSQAEQALLQKLFDSGKLPPWGERYRKAALEKSYQILRRMERKLKQGEERLSHARAEVNAAPKASTSPSKAESPAAEANPKPSKKPGLWVLLRGKIWLRIGRSASENDELYRQAKDRDLWFHVRGHGGAHVWVPRGQKNFGAKTEVPDWLIEKAAQVALLNSQLRESGQASVDYTERRYLKKNQRSRRRFEYPAFKNSFCAEGRGL
jgi:hypothetical protein